jgi:DNA repair exonuclease SbcCD ATPase subunit
MQITIKELELRNFLSFGNNITRLDFRNPGLISLAGKNAAGKSTILDALSFVLYGTPYRKIKKGELINRSNKKDLWTRLTFNKNTIKYRITRSLKPNTIKIEKWCDKQHEYVEQELLSTASLIQEDINNIFGIEYKTFRHIVCISPVANNTKPFLAMSPYEKRTLIESLFNLEVVSEMSRHVKSDKSSNKLEKRNLEENNTLLESLVKQSKNAITDARKTEETFSHNKQVTLDEFNNQLVTFQGKRDKLIVKLNAFKKALKPELEAKIKDKYTTSTTNIKELESQLYEKKYIIKDSTKKVNGFDGIDICPVCNTNVSKEHVVEELEKLGTLIKTASSEITDLKTNIEKAESIKETLKGNLSDLKEVKISINSVITSIDDTDRHIKHLEQHISAKEKEQLDLDFTKREQELETNTVRLEDGVSKFNKCCKLETIYETAEYLLSDSGIKTEFYHVVVPMFNKIVNEYIQNFELPVVINFNYEFDVTIKTLHGADTDLNYYSFSEGEKKRIEVAILLSFIKMSKTIANWSVNILLLDEILGQYLDKKGLDIVLESIREIATEEQLNVLVVSHKDMGEDTFDKKILITKTAMFSKLEVIN